MLDPDVSEVAPGTGWRQLFSEGRIVSPTDIIHVQSRGLLSSAIRWFSTKWTEKKEAWPSHTAMVFALEPEPMIIEALRTVQVRPLSAYKGTKARLVVSRKPGALTEEEKTKVIAKAREYQGEKYGYFRVVAHALDHLFGDIYFFRRMAGMDPYPICSWLVGYSYQRALGIELGGPPDEIDPDDIMDYCMKNEWPIVWADSEETLKSVQAIYSKRAAEEAPSKRPTAFPPDQGSDP